MMVAQVIADLKAAGVGATVAADPRFAAWFAAMGVETVTPHPNEASAVFFRRILTEVQNGEGVNGVRNAADPSRLFLPIAPEGDYYLANLVKTAADLGVECLASTPNCIRLASNKEALGRRALRFGISSVLRAPFGRHYALKPLSGAGCEGVYRTRRRPRPLRGRLVTPWLDGEHLSLAAIFKHGRGRLLQVNRQHLRIGIKGKVELERLESGIAVTRMPFERLVARLAEALPGLWGFCGVDLIRRRSRLWLVEVNPRLTTAYLGFYRPNPIEWLLALRTAPLAERYPPPPKMRIGL